MDKRSGESSDDVDSSLRIVDVSGSNYQDIPDDFFSRSNCQSCLYWEMNWGLHREGESEQKVLKREWFNSAGCLFGSCGKLAYANGEVVAWAQYAPAVSLPRAGTFPIHPSDDAYFISCLAVRPGYRRRGFGEKLLKAIIDDLRGRGLGAVETFARRSSPDNPSGPVELYLKLGFRVKNDDDHLPLLRLSLRSFPNESPLRL